MSHRVLRESLPQSLQGLLNGMDDSFGCGLWQIVGVFAAAAVEPDNGGVFE